MSNRTKKSVSIILFIVSFFIIINNRVYGLPAGIRTHWVSTSFKWQGSTTGMCVTEGYDSQGHWVYTESQHYNYFDNPITATQQGANQAYLFAQTGCN